MFPLGAEFQQRERPRVGKGREYFPGVDPPRDDCRIFVF